MDPTERLAAAVERLATVLELMFAAQAAEAAMIDCARCRGRGHLGHPNMRCPACDGAGRVAA